MVYGYRSTANALLVCLQHLQQLEADPHPLLAVMMKMMMMLMRMKIVMLVMMMRFKDYTCEESGRRLWRHEPEKWYGCNRVTVVVLESNGCGATE